ncbi:hypothetical protein FSW04_23050 [Baekduia soli]|uniref:Redoxin domain-containing protein n=1 Tax=Baekduia soli TaxID=496014 RepID=A0A5B8UAS0_9ACTN|nr:hypothetical protein [Baekduia soli]QEC50170.1 hypothetical protein FSW04_23050 [Baekduia soli]
MTGGGREPGPLDFEPDARDDGPIAPGPAPPARRPSARRPDGGGPGSGTPRYVWVVGVAAVVLVAALVVSTLSQGTRRGARGVPDGQVVPPFAVPLALSDLDGDANLATHAGDGAAGARPACSVRGPRVLNGCALGERGPFVLAFFATRGSRCVRQLDTMEQVRRRVPGVAFAAIAIRGDRPTLRAIVRRHGWGFPVGYDRDGGLSNAYHVQVCPQLTFAARGGRVVATTFGVLGAADLTTRARALAGR